MKNKALKFINPILALFFLVTIVCVALYKYGPATLRGSETLGELHAFGGILFFFTALIHIYLNWNWVKMNLLGGKKPKK